MTILILDDEPVIRDVLRTVLGKAGFGAAEAGTAAEGLERLASEPVDLLLLDLMLPDRPGLEVLAEVRARWPDLPVVVITAYSSVESAISAMRQGAYHYIPKPFRNDEIVHVVRQALETRRLVAENRELKARLDGKRGGLGELVGRGATMEKVFDTVRQAANARSTILVVGESGTGKELVARALHRLSPRSAGPFVTVNSGSLPPDLLESNLFGHVRGSFTGAVADKRGLFKVADGGTIFFDEIGTIPLETQSKLLRVLQEREFLPVGAVEPIRADVRVVAATNADLPRLVAEGRFREDLYYRLCVIPLHLAPLRSRRGDVASLAEHFVRMFSPRGQAVRLTPSAVERLQAHHWPGNIRELRNVIHRALLLRKGPVIDAADLAFDQEVNRETGVVVPELPQGLTLEQMLERLERQIVEAALRRHNNNRERVAKELGVARSTLFKRLKDWGITRQDETE